jgi:phosphatidylglycerol---prolipoprotein diacylglyceryl transferase
MDTILSITWDVSPELFSLGPVVIRYYGLLFVLGFITGYYIFQRFYRIEGIPIAEVDRLSVWVFVGSVIGARLGHVFFYEPHYYLQNPLDIFKVWEGGLASHGGTIGLFITLWFYAQRKFPRYLWILDRMSLATALAGAFIRLGNLMNSEIYGHYTDLPWGFIFVRDFQSIPRHPTQIYEALAYFGVFIFLWVLYNRKKTLTPRGIMIGWFLILVFGARFMVEFVKEVQVGFEEGMLLNMGQILSIPFIVLGVVFLIFAHKVPITSNEDLGRKKTASTNENAPDQTGMEP